MQKILVIVAAVLSLAAAGLGYLNRGKLTASRAETAKFKSESSENAKKADKLSADLKTANEKLAVMGSDAEKSAAEMTDLRSQLSKATGNVADLQKQVSDRDAAAAQQKTDMEAKDARIAELESKVAQALQPAANPAEELKKQLEEKDILTTSLQAKLNDQESQLKALKESEKKHREKIARNGLQGKVLAVNSSWNFVVLSLGDRNGIVNGTEMLVSRSGQRVAKVRVTSVEPSTSIADIVANSIRSGTSVLPGDMVIYQGPSEETDSKLP